MRFTNGFWLIRDGMQLQFPKIPYESRVAAGKLTVYAPCMTMENKGNCLNGGTITIEFTAPRNDIIQAIQFGAPEPLIAFCQAIQANSPVDSFVVPEPWAMPGYQDPVSMAAGTFVSGASIELSADAPIRAPYIAYLQGGLTYAHGKVALMGVL